MKMKLEPTSKCALKKRHIKKTAFLPSRDLHPSLEGRLKELRKHLVESTNEMAPLKVWQLQGDESGEEPLACLLSKFCCIKKCRIRTLKF